MRQHFPVELGKFVQCAVGRYPAIRLLALHVQKLATFRLLDPAGYNNARHLLFGRTTPYHLDLIIL